jgi:hypothetical protein
MALHQPNDTKFIHGYGYPRIPLPVWMGMDTLYTHGHGFTP